MIELRGSYRQSTEWPLEPIEHCQPNGSVSLVPLYGVSPVMSIDTETVKQAVHKALTVELRVPCKSDKK